ncbi:MAG: glycoside hydrolase family 2 protein [Porphyromonas sp.]|nr:glycoside hydrolase family 2 protein [Porphyromonas sp.]
MNKNRSILLLLFLIVVVPSALSSHAKASSQSGIKSEVLRNWRYKSLTDTLWSNCVIPSLVQENLIKEKKLPIPYYRDNEKRVQWVSDSDWVYATTFNVSETNRSAGVKQILEFDGIDTFGEVYLNGEHLGSTENMFLVYSYDVTDKLIKGENNLVVHLKSPTRTVHPQYLSNGFNYPADNDHFPIRYSPFTRKAPYHYGWDWGMRMLTMGIWKEVRLSTYHTARIGSVDVETEIDWSQNNEAKQASVLVNMECIPFGKELCFAEAELASRQSGKKWSVDMDKSDLNQKTFRFSIGDPELWWPREWGKANLYTLTVRLLDKDKKEIDRNVSEIGIREIRLINKPDDNGTSFYFEVNKRPIFAKGANYIPGDLMLTKRTDEYFKSLFDDVEFANMNMIRVWGGGAYEDDRFYTEANRRGILVWQDFMFGCTAYPADKAFLENVRREAIYQVKRLRNHPCIAFWCGNNEIEEGILYWGWQKRLSPEHYQQLKDSYAPLFHDLLPSVIKEYAPRFDYIHGSPMGSNWGQPQTFTNGDIHYWGLWYGKQPFEVFEKYPMRFVSEYGFQSFPSMKTISTFALPEDYGLETEVMKVHQKASTGNGLIKEYMEREYIVPEKFEDFVYVGQVLHGRGMAKSIRAMRRQRPVCMGSLYWQLNDAWPAVSWSSVDFFQNYKGMHYTTREAYAPVAIMTKDMGKDSLAIFVANDKLNALPSGSLRLETRDIWGKKLYAKTLSLSPIAANAVTEVGVFSKRDLAMAENTTERVLSINFSTKGDNAHLLWYAVATKEMDLPDQEVKYRVIKQIDGEAVVRFKADRLIKDLFIETPWHATRFSDNFFDLFPGGQKDIVIRHSEISKKTPLKLELKTMNDIHKKYKTIETI